MTPTNYRKLKGLGLCIVFIPMRNPAVAGFPQCSYFHELEEKEERNDK